MVTLNRHDAHFPADPKETPEKGQVLLIQGPMWGGKSFVLQRLAEKNGHVVQTLSGIHSFRFPWDFQVDHLFLDDFHLWHRYKRLRRMAIETWISNHLTRGGRITACWGLKGNNPWSKKWPQPIFSPINQPDEGHWGTSILWQIEKQSKVRRLALENALDIHLERIRGDLTARWCLAEMAHRWPERSSLSYLAKTLEISPQALLPVLQAMEQAGLVNRTPRLWTLADPRWVLAWGFEASRHERVPGVNKIMSEQGTRKSAHTNQPATTKNKETPVRQPSWQADWD